MIISPTRELAIQIFEVLVKIGRKGHLFAAGLIIGGKSLQEEQNSLGKMNIVVCTPGRILQHLSQTHFFSCDNLKMLVLDEADRILDMGFQKDVDAIVEYLPKERQTLLFSATQTKRVSDLARLSLKDPEYVSMREASENATPKDLQQNYVVTPLHEKLDTLWSFIQSTKKSKILVFLSSGKQVRFVYEAFRHLQPGIPLLHLLGRQKQANRLEITKRFSAAKTSCLFATDVVARGLDFPAVDWVVQVDCPEDADTYIHRVGRTARYGREGRAVLFLDPSEEAGMLARLEAKHVPIEQINVRQKKQTSIKPQLQNMCFKDPELKYLGQKSFASYVRSVYLQADKEVFQVDKLPLEEYAASLGLPGAPKIKFIKGSDVKAKKNAPRMNVVDTESDNDDADTALQARPEKAVRTKYDRMFDRRNQGVLADHYARMVNDDGDADGLDGVQVADDNLLSVKRRIPALSEDDSDDETATAQLQGGRTVQIPGSKTALVVDSKRREKLLTSKKKLLKLKDKGTRMVYDDEGNAHPIYELENEDQFKAAGAAEDQRDKFIQGESERVREADVLDKAAVKAKKRAKKEKRREAERAEAGHGAHGDDSDDGQEEDAMANFLADAQSEQSEQESMDEPTQKRAKKWFEEEGRVEQKRKAMPAKAPETLEDLEALASGYLG